MTVDQLYMTRINELVQENEKLKEAINTVMEMSYTEEDYQSVFTDGYDSALDKIQSHFQRSLTYLK
jgi:hypothetical protein